MYYIRRWSIVKTIVLLCLLCLLCWNSGPLDWPCSDDCGSPSSRVYRHFSARAVRLITPVGASVLLKSSNLKLSNGQRESKPGKLPRLKINKETLTVSGISSGGFMAHQFEIAFASRLAGAGIVAGGPFYCAANNVEIALNACMKYPETIVPQALATFAMEAEAVGQIDRLADLSHHRVFVFSGSKDTVVKQGVSRKMVSLYEALGGVSQLHVEMNIPAEHAWITSSGYGGSCGHLGSPYINTCDYSVTREMFRTFYGNVHVPTPQFLNDTSFFKDQLVTFNQDLYTYDFSYMNSVGYLYVPKACRDGKNECHLHVNFHGCHQCVDDLGEDYVLHNGLNAYAELNQVVILYPQTRQSLLNPKSCWDWWGYTDPLYFSKYGPQPASVMNMIDTIIGS